MTLSASQCTLRLPPDLRLGEPITDATHVEFMRLLDAANMAPDEALPVALDEWIAHTQEHFAQEESWMEAMDFGPRHCHAAQHRHVLDIADRVREKLTNEGRIDLARELIGALHEWFAHHVQTMDAMMVASMLERGEAHVA